MTLHLTCFHKIFIILLLLIDTGGCETVAPYAPPVAFGEGNTILKTVMVPALSGHGMAFEEMDWSGGGDRDSFAVHGSIFVKDVTAADLSEELVAELKKLPAARGWDSFKYRIRGSKLIGIEYVEKGSRFYLDIVLCEQKADIEMLILHKGVRL